MRNAIHQMPVVKIVKKKVDKARVAKSLKFEGNDNNEEVLDFSGETNHLIQPPKHKSSNVTRHDTELRVTHVDMLVDTEFIQAGLTSDQDILNRYGGTQDDNTLQESVYTNESGFELLSQVSLNKKSIRK